MEVIISSVTVRGVEIRIDDLGLFCLNDLQEAANFSGDRCSPQNFIESAAIQSIVFDIVSHKLIACKINEQEIWACKEIAILFALSVNSAFYVEVFRSLAAEGYSVIDAPLKHGGRLLSFDEMCSTGWNLELLKLAREGYNKVYKIECHLGLQQEARSLLHIIEKQRYKILKFEHSGKKAQNRRGF